MKNLVLFSALLLLSVAAFAQDGTMMKADDSAPDGAMMKGDTMMKGDSMMKADSVPDPSAYDVKGLGKQVVAFTTEKDAWQLAKSQTVVYFFAATWCPTCQATYKDLKANFTKLPAGLTVVFVNYDKATDLKKSTASPRSIRSWWSVTRVRKRRCGTARRQWPRSRKTRS